MTNQSDTKADLVNEAAILQVDVQYALDDDEADKPPSQSSLSSWAEIAYLTHLQCNAEDSTNKDKNNIKELTIRLVGESEMRTLNHQYRTKDSVTNVLSFPFENEFDCHAEVTIGLLGDIVICHSVLVSEAQQQDKTLADHYAHMVAHGVLHLCGYDHQDTKEAQQMESLEVMILAQSDIPNPYTVTS